MAKKARTANTSTDEVERYARDVIKGKILAGPYVRAACKRHLRDLKTGHKRGLVWDYEAASRAFGFFNDVLHLNGGQFEGLPFVLIDWEYFVVGSLFGWKNAEGLRRFRKAFIETGKGSGKSPLAAGIGLYMLSADAEPRAEIYAAATKKDQAKVLFRDAVAMVEQSEDLDALLHMSGGLEKTNIAFLAKGSFFRPISSEDRGKGQSGPRPHCGLLDEIHEHPSNLMVEMMDAGIKWRRQPLTFMITNSGDSRQTVCFEYHEYGAKVAEGSIEDDTFFAYICALDEKDKPLRNEKCWSKVNPSLIPVNIPGMEYLRKQVREAKGLPSKENVVLRLNFCTWTEAETSAVSREVWEKCEAEFDPEILKGRRCAGGIDLSGKKDLTALGLVFEFEAGEIDLLPDGGVLALVEFWTPGDTLLDREEQDRVPYIKWKKDGFIKTTPGKTVNYGFVAKRLAEINATYELTALAYDRWRIDDLQRELDDIGVEINLVPHGQGFKDMSPAWDAAEDLIINTKLRVLKNPCMRWNVASAVIIEDPAANRKFAKNKSTGRIDGLVALTMGVSALNTDEDEPSVYETEELFFV